MSYNVLAEKLNTEGENLFKRRGYLPLILLILGVSIKYFEYHSAPSADPNKFGENNTLLFLSVLIGVTGLAIRIITVGYSPENTSGRNTNAGQVADQLNTKGLYSLTRNPLYLGNFLMWFSIAVFIGNLWFVVVFTLGFWIYYERIIFSEEKFLTQKFGEKYIEWAKQTPIFLPLHLRYKRPTISFSWKKALKKEKNGLFALFLVLFFFEFIDKSLFHQKPVLEWNFLSIATLSSGLIYFVLKYIKKHTHWLDEIGR